MHYPVFREPAPKHINIPNVDLAFIQVFTLCPSYLSEQGLNLAPAVGFFRRAGGHQGPIRDHEPARNFMHLCTSEGETTCRAKFRDGREKVATYIFIYHGLKGS